MVVGEGRTRFRPALCARAFGIAAATTLTLAATKVARGEPAQIVISSVADSVEIRVAKAENKAVIAECRGRCVFSAEAGSYTVMTRDLETDKRHELDLRIKRSGRFKLQEPDYTARYLGLGFGIAGPLSLLVGAVLVAPAVSGSSCPATSTCQGSSSEHALLGLGLLMGGAIATPIGWGVFVDNRARLVPADTGVSKAPQARLRVGVGGIAPGAVGLGGVGSF